VAREKLGNRRVTGKEQFYTPPELADAVCHLVLASVPDALERPWLEPAGGTGAFIDAARRVGAQQITSFDIEPHHDEVTQGDFLTQVLSLSNAIAVSNPPFGRNNSLSVPFFNTCANYCDYITFVVPRSWRKWSVINRLDRHFHLIDDLDLSVNYVDVDGHDRYEHQGLKTCAQIWERRVDLRPLIRVPDLGVVRKVGPMEADVALTVFGYSCGAVKTEFPRRKVTTEMYLKLEHPRALEALRAVDFSRFSTNVAYTEALSISEINFLLNEYLFGDSNGPDHLDDNRHLMLS
jgi:hypothetical protein